MNICFKKFTVVTIKQQWTYNYNQCNSQTKVIDVVRYAVNQRGQYAGHVSTTEYR